MMPLNQKDQIESSIAMRLESCRQWLIKNNESGPSSREYPEWFALQYTSCKENFNEFFYLNNLNKEKYLYYILIGLNNLVIQITDVESLNRLVDSDDEGEDSDDYF